MSNELEIRYASTTMVNIVSNERRPERWIRLWWELAKEQSKYKVVNKQLVLNKELENTLHSLSGKDLLNHIKIHEKKTKHEVTALLGHLEKLLNVDFFHIGATSSYVTDNADLIMIRQGLELILKRINHVLTKFVQHATEFENLRVVSYTHFQPAQPTTLGKRMSMWASDLYEDARSIIHFLDELPFRGIQGATGTQSSFLRLLGKGKRIDAINKSLSKTFGFKKTLLITGQTYPRKIDTKLMNLLSGVAESAHKFATDIRLLQNIGEVGEGFGSTQTGSSVMPFKKNPLHSERICGLSRYVFSLCSMTPVTAGSQWLERTLDDSSFRRLTIPNALMAVDGILLLYYGILRDLEINVEVIESNLMKHYEKFASEGIMIDSIQSGLKRSDAYELMRKYFLLKKSHTPKEIKAKQITTMVGRAPEQVRKFISILKKHLR